jgi:hypothetical protein
MKDSNDSFVIYGWDPNGDRDQLGHYILVHEKKIIDDRYRRNGIVRVLELTEKTMRSALYGNNTLLKLYVVTKSTKVL